MLPRPIVGILTLAVLASSLLVGCDSSPTNSTAPEGHTGKNEAGGHSGQTPAAGPNSPLAKKAAPKG
jgi:hypothetical protein